MTLNRAITELVMMRENPMMPAVFKSSLDKVIETVSECEEPERKMGKWIWNENGMDWGLGAWCCSECGSKPETWWESDKRNNPLRCAGGRFCGNCGADMRGEQE